MKFKSWLAKIVLNESRLIARRPQSLPLEETVAAESYDTEIKIDVADAVMRLDEKYRLVIILFYYVDLPVNEIAELLNIPKGTVVSQLSRARELLRKELKEYGV